MTREELIAYDKWLTRRKWGTGEIISPEKAADLYLAEHPLPPAEGAKIRGDADAILSRFKDNVRGSVVTSYNIVFYEDAIQAMYEFAALQQPTAEGAEEILQRNMDNQFLSIWEASLKSMKEFATLHAQKIADKIVEERLREELIAYDKYIGNKGWIDNYEDDTAEPTVDKYLENVKKS